MSSEHQVISLKLLVNKCRDQVIFAESDYEFIDTLLSFLTLPLGTVVQLLSPDSTTSTTNTTIGCITEIYKSVESLEVRLFRTEFCKAMLLNPRNASETQCSKLKLNVYPREPVKFYKCDDWINGAQGTIRCRFSTFRAGQCGCGNSIYSPVTIGEGKGMAACGEEGGGGGVFVKDGATRFMITDDLQVIAGSTDALISLFGKLGINDGNQVEERTIQIKKDEVLCLLKFALLSKSPLTEAILHSQGSSVKDTVKFQQKKTKADKKAAAVNSNNMNLKIFVSKSKKIVLYAEAGVDVVDFLFSFLTFPLGSVIKLLGKNSGFGCMDNLYKTAEDLSDGSYIKSEEGKKMLVCPKLAPFFSLKNHIFQIEEASYPQYVYDSNREMWLARVAKAEPGRSSAEQSKERGRVAVFMDPKSPTGQVEAGKGYVKGPATFMITDNLFVTPLSPIRSIALLNQLRVPIRDVVERVVTISNDEALNLLNASLISKTVLTDVFIQREPYPEIMLKV